MPNFNVCGTIYPYPNVGDNPWGTIHINWASAVSTCLTSVNTAVALTFANPMNAQGDMIYEDAGLTPVALPIGTNGDVLTVVAGIPAWTAASAVPGNVPIGSILPWCDFNGVLTLDANYRYMDGTVIVAATSPIDGLTTDDLSGAYIVGYGTLGAGDIGTAPYSVAPVGNADHQIAINHTHTMAHTHAGPSHTHSHGTIEALIGPETGGTNRITLSQTANTFTGTNRWATGGIGMDTVNALSSGSVDTTGNTGAGGTANTGAASTATTSSGLSATQSIQPRSQRYRFIIRVL